MSSKLSALKKAMPVLIFIVSSILIFGCSTTQMTAVWKDTQFSGPQLKKFVVIALMQELSNRTAYENQMVKNLKENGTDAIPSLSLLNPDQDYKYEEMENKFNQLGIDGILIIDLKGKETETTTIPGEKHVVYETVYDNYYHAYITIKKEVTTPPKIIKTTIQSLEANLFLNQTDKLIWRAELKSIEDNFVSLMANDLSKLVIENLQAYNLIKTNK